MGRKYKPASQMTPDELSRKRESRRRSYRKHREEIKAKRKGHYVANRERILAQSSAYHARNREARCAANLARYHRSPLALYRASQLVAQGGGCAICGGLTPEADGWHVDHDHSVDGRKSGQSDPSSWRGVTCYPCNSCLITAYERDPARWGPLMPGVAAYVNKWSAIIQQRQSVQRSNAA